jgi:uncharacterized protein (DUF427 family)
LQLKFGQDQNNSKCCLFGRFHQTGTKSQTVLPNRYSQLGHRKTATVRRFFGIIVAGKEVSGASQEIEIMKAVVEGELVAQSNDVVECKGYQYFPRTAVRTEWLEKAPKTESDLACPHGVQFYDVVVAGKRHERAAWSYEAPRPEMKQVCDLFGFWQDVKVS